MANVSVLNTYRSTARGAGVFAQLRVALAEYRQFRAIRAEMNELSDRELADIGISRHNINDLAWEAARS